jgi:outer membrane protein assembly factor BamE (lipoprotein component of BamABCDE complex)
MNSCWLEAFFADCKITKERTIRWTLPAKRRKVTGNVGTMKIDITLLMLIMAVAISSGCHTPGHKTSSDREQTGAVSSLSDEELELRFDRITKGMDQKTILDIMNCQPKCRSDSGTIWYYVLSSKRDTSDRIAFSLIIHFENGRVVKTEKSHLGIKHPVLRE